MENISSISLTAEEMAEHCLINYLNEETEKTLKDKRRKNLQKCFLNFCSSLLKELQSDEQCILYFAGVHDYSAFWSLGPYVYMLTNRRLIMVGAYNSKLDFFNYLQMYKANWGKNFICKKDSLYLTELKKATVDMINGYDIIKFHAEEKSFNVMFFRSNITHSLCDEINEALDRIHNFQ